MPRRLTPLIVLLVATMMANRAAAQAVIGSATAPEENLERKIWLPFAFYMGLRESILVPMLELPRAFQHNSVP